MTESVETKKQKDRVEDMIFNTVMSRSQLLKSLTDPRRDIDNECGYPVTSELDALRFKDFYLREGVATRVVQVLPQECWQVTPEICETEDKDEETVFEKALEDLRATLQGNGYFKGEEGNPLWEKLSRVDELSGIGRYGVILLGLDDGKELSEPVDGIDASGNKVGNAQHKLLYMHVFDETLAPITSYENDSSNPRYGRPLTYSITFSDPNNMGDQVEGESIQGVTKTVHWSRIVHIADNLMSSELFGVPRQLGVFNRLWDIRKLYSGSAEMYWRGAFPGISIETHPQLGGDVEVDAAAMRTTMENYMTGLQRYLQLSGMSAKTLAPQVVDPTPQINTQIEAICINKGIPKRVFVGSERGELASSQDDDTWKDRLRYRQKSYITPKIIVPVIDRLIIIGVLPEPEQYTVTWQSFDNMSEEQKADIAVKRTQALAQYVSGNVENVITPLDYLVTFVGLEKEKAEEILKATEEVEEDEQFTISPTPEPLLDPMGNPVKPTIPGASKPTTPFGKTDPSAKDLKDKGDKDGNQKKAIPSSGK